MRHGLGPSLRKRSLGVLLGLLVLAGRADGQMLGGQRGGLGVGYGYGLGFNYGYTYGRAMGNYHAPEINYIYQQSLQNAARAAPSNGSQTVQVNPYHRQLRQGGYLDGYEAGARREIESRIGRHSDGPSPRHLAARKALAARAPAAAAPQTPTHPVVITPPLPAPTPQPKAAPPALEPPPKP